MDPFAWLVTVAAVIAAATLVAFAPQLKRDHRRRQLGGAGGGGLAGLGAGMDAVWRPSAEDAHAQWQAQLEVPAPAPTPGDKGRMEDGRIVIEVSGDP